MRKVILIISVVLFCTSCFLHKGKKIDEQCRPKNPNFKLLKAPFKGTNNLVFKKIYIIQSNPKPFGYGFYSDGKIIFLHSKNGQSLEMKDIENKNWSNAPAVGYWRFDGVKLKTEYFSCSNSGNYIREEGIIKGDTIFFERDCGSSPFRRNTCYDKYVLSEMIFE